MNKGKINLVKAVVLILFTGCANNPMLPNQLNSSSNQKSLIFKTNKVNFINELSNKSNKGARNSYINEFLLKSDMQCRSYLSSPVQNAPRADLTQNELYMNIFDTVSTVFGLSYITNTAKSLLSANSSNNLENQHEYQKALSPEIKRGVEINRERYAKKIKNRENQSIKKYPIGQVNRDLLIYDKQCNEAYGLIEINRALKAMRENIYQQPMKSAINVEAVKKSVTQATKKVQKKEKEKKKIKNSIVNKDNNATSKKQ